MFSTLRNRRCQIGKTKLGDREYQKNNYTIVFGGTFYFENVLQPIRNKHFVVN